MRISYFSGYLTIRVFISINFLADLLKLLNSKIWIQKTKYMLRVGAGPPRLSTWLLKMSVYSHNYQIWYRKLSLQQNVLIPRPISKLWPLTNDLQSQAQNCESAKLQTIEPSMQTSWLNPCSSYPPAPTLESTCLISTSQTQSSSQNMAQIWLPTSPTSEPVVPKPFSRKRISQTAQSTLSVHAQLDMSGSTSRSYTNRLIRKPFPM